MYALAPGALAAPVRKRQPWLVVGLVGLVVLLLVAGSGVAYFLHQQAGPHSGSAVGIGGAATPTASPSGGAVILSDPLTSNVNGWPEDSQCQFGTGGYHLIGNVTCFAPVGDLTDATVQVQAELLQGSTDDGYGIALRRVSRNSEYFFSVSGHGDWSFSKAVNGTITYLVNWKANAAVRGGLNRPNLLKVTMQGSQFDFFINGVLVGSASDTTYANGEVGLSSSGNGTGSTPSDVMFTHLLITTGAS